ncbi:hypothetical protein [Streptomyces zaomyceticus]|uniref:hypothetical protein n=1 Tax=Streptomyces zaomyceticus TaxID=68286 RepID=UPI002E1A1016
MLEGLPGHEFEGHLQENEEVLDALGVVVPGDPLRLEVGAVAVVGVVGDLIEVAVRDNGVGSGALQDVQAADRYLAGVDVAQADPGLAGGGNGSGPATTLYDTAAFLRPQPAAALPGIGPDTARTLGRLGITAATSPTPRSPPSSGSSAGPLAARPTTAHMASTTGRSFPPPLPNPSASATGSTATS